MTRQEAQAALDTFTKVQAGEGAKHDTGYIYAISNSGNVAYVSWNRGVRTPCPVWVLQSAD